MHGFPGRDRIADFATVDQTRPIAMPMCRQCSSDSPASLVATQFHPTSGSAARKISSVSDSSEDERFLPGTLLGDRYRIVSLLPSKRHR
jgi:hypothetical protein